MKDVEGAQKVLCKLVFCVTLSFSIILLEKNIRIALLALFLYVV